MSDTLDRNATFDALVTRLSRQSVAKHADAYNDIEWDAPHNALDPADTRWKLWPKDPLGETTWYQSLPPDQQARVAMHRIATGMRVGGQFENLLQQGLLAYVYRLPNRTPEFRFLHHEVVEESQHTMMFQEFVNRSGLRVGGIPRPWRLVARAVPPLNRLFPELFFMFVLGGEDPVDYLQRQQLRNGVDHPLLEQIMRIHVTEEARHLSFARSFLKEQVPRLRPVRRHLLAALAPLLFGQMVRMMVLPNPQLYAEYRVPAEVRREVRTSPATRRLLVEAAAKPRRLCAELGLDTWLARRLWPAVGLGRLTAG